MPSPRSPLSRPIAVADIPPEGLEFAIEADEAERRALAEDFDLSAVHRLVGDYRLQRVTGGVRVTGRVEAEVEQTCVVTLDPVINAVSESVDLLFCEHAPAPDAEPARSVHPSRVSRQRKPAQDSDSSDSIVRKPQEVCFGEREPPEPIVNGRIDLGSVTAEFLALGLDPYPRKPGVTFAEPEPDPADSPFAALARIRKS